jgi:hypothetical protein
MSKLGEELPFTMNRKIYERDKKLREKYEK